ncbi:MAG TPA: DUF2059 domain-containing protein [Pelobium sp.]|nr:DUF2059 domain-containing protein [Pelobium sp.]
MKKIKQSITFVVILMFLSAGAFSQTSPTKAEKIKTLLELTGSANLGKQMFEQMIGSFKSRVSKVPDSFWETFQKEIDMDGLMAKTIPLYDKYYTEAEIDGLISFYQSDLGKKVITTLPPLMKESMEIGQAWGREIGEKVMKKLKEEEEKNKQP